MVRNVEAPTAVGPIALINAPQQVSQKTIPALERMVDDGIAQRPAFLDVNFSAVHVIDSIGLNWLLSVQSRLNSLGIQLRISEPSPIVADILLATRLDTRFPVQFAGVARHG